jgi:long-chain acyl-CoA synthetase
VYSGILEKGNMLTGYKKAIFNLSVKKARTFRFGKNDLFYKMKHALLDKLVYKKWREALGGRLVRIICGGAALQEELLRTFWAARMPVFEGYGLTETSPLISNNNYRVNKMGTVGKILEGVTVRIHDDGEILVKTPGLMLGYYKKPELTADAIDREGWFHTGDIGEIHENIFLKITGRKKEIFKTSSGIYIVPDFIENRLRQSSFISYAFVAGDNRNELTALLVPDFNYLRNWCSLKNINCTSYPEMVRSKDVVKKYAEIIDEYNANARETEIIRNFQLLDKEWSVDTGELTPKMSLRRKIIEEKYLKSISPQK